MANFLKIDRAMEEVNNEDYIPIIVIDNDTKSHWHLFFFTLSSARTAIIRQPAVSGRPCSRARRKPNAQGLRVPMRCDCRADKGALRCIRS